MTSATSSPTLTRRGLLGSGVALAVGAATARADDQAAPLVVYACRHAEKGTEGNDPALTEAGTARAETLASMLKDVPLRAVFSTDTVRTRTTAGPTAKGHALEVTTYAPKGLLKALGDQGGAVLVVGHSNTIPASLRELGADLPAAELEGFDDLFVLVKLPGQVVLQRLHYGAASGASGAMHR